MESLAPEAECLLRACCQAITPKLEETFDYIEIGKSLGLDELAASDIADELSLRGFFQPLAYGTQAYLDQAGREYARTSLTRSARTLSDAARAKGTGSNGVKVFIAHSSIDKDFVRKLAEKLRLAGFHPWLDDGAIKVGESITAKIEQGLAESQYVILVLSKVSVDSKWVEQEWRAKYWDQVNHSKVCLLPALLQKCDIPPLLKDKKYADFTKGFDLGVSELIDAMTPVSPTAVAKPIRSADHAAAIMTLISKANEKEIPISRVLVDVLGFARQTGNKDLAEFCKTEIGGIPEPRGDEELGAKARPWRVIECFASTVGALNPGFIAFQSETALFNFLEAHPDKFVPMRLIWSSNIQELEDFAADRKSTSTALVYQRKHGTLMADSKTPDADVYIYMRPNTHEKILRGIRRVLLERLLGELPAMT